jgi:putative transposase
MMNVRTITVRKRHLSHWTTEEGTYFVTFRQADALSPELARRIRERPGAHLLTDRFLDKGKGSCVLLDRRAARIVEDALRFFDCERYRLHGWCVMPNHVHVALRTAPGVELGSVTKSWKGFTGRRINQLLGRSGEFWQGESFDSLLSDQNELSHALAYIANNPVRARLIDWPWVGIVDQQFRFRAGQE